VSGVLTSTRSRLFLRLAALARDVLWVYALRGTGGILADDEPAASGIDDTTIAAGREDDTEWPQLSPLELGVCLADGETATPTRPVRARSQDEFIA